MGKEEGTIERYLNDEVIKQGGFTRKYTSPGRRGVADRIVFWEGVTFVEVKTPSGQLSKLQEKEVQRMVQAGAVIEVLSSKQAIDEWIADRLYWLNRLK